MARQSITVRVDDALRDSLDQIATNLDRDRSYIVNEALTAYVELHKWQIEHIQQGIREADAGKFVPDDEVKRTLKKLRGK